VTRGGRAALLVATLFVANAPAYPATPPPQSARSSSLRVPPGLLDDPVNAYTFPQLGAEEAGTLVGFGSTGSGAAGSGVHVDPGSTTLTFLSVRSLPSGTDPTRDLPVYRIGWSALRGRARLGVAYAWSAFGEKRRRESTQRSTLFDVVRRIDSSFRTLGLREASAGFGWGEGDFALDLEASLAWEKLDSRWSERQQTIEGPYVRQVNVTEMDLGADALPGFSAKLRAPARGMRLDAYGSYRSLTLDFREESRAEFEDSNSISVSSTIETDRHPGHEWSAGTRLGLGSSVRGAVHAFWTSRHEPWKYETFGDGWERERREVETGELGVSCEFPLPFETSGLAGLAVRRSAASVETSFDSNHENLLRRETKTRESEFGWGAARTFGPIDLTAAVSQILSPSELFLSVDARARF